MEEFKVALYVIGLLLALYTTFLIGEFLIFCWSKTSSTGTKRRAYDFTRSALRVASKEDVQSFVERRALTEHRPDAYLEGANLALSEHRLFNT